MTSPPPADSAQPDRPGRVLRELLTDRLGRWSIRSLQIIAVLLLVVALVAALVQVRLVVVPTLIAIILAAAAVPLISWLRGRGIPNALAAWITLLVAVVIVGGILTLVVSEVIRQWPRLADSAREGVEDVRGWLETLPFDVDTSQLDDIREQLLDYVTTAEFGLGAVAGVSAAVEVIAGILLAIIVLYFLLKDGDRIWAFLLKPLDAERTARGERIGRVSVGVLGGYARGTAIIALFDAVIIGGTLAILRVPLALPLALLIFLGAFIPIVGATVTGILAALVALVTGGPIAALVVVIVTVLVNQLEGDILQPIVMAQSVRLHPLVILLALTAGTILGGIVGALLSVPVAAVTWAIIRVWNGEPPPQPKPRPGDRLRRLGKKPAPKTAEDTAAA